ncbi:MAG: hypothetical protein ABSA31_02230 [Acidimicrobiales bacterium]
MIPFGIMVEAGNKEAKETPEKFVKVPIGLTEELYEWLRDTAYRRRVSMAQVVREALSAYKMRGGE